MPTIAVPTLLAHADHAHAAPGASSASSLLLAAVPFLVAGVVLLRGRKATGFTVVLFSAAAGFIHAVVTPEHFREDLAVGLFTLAVTVGQMVVVVAALNRPSRALWTLAGAGNAVVLAIWALSRTTGLPVGPAPGTPEAVGLLDLACAAYEVAVVAGCVSLATIGLTPRFSGSGASATPTAALANP